MQTRDRLTNSLALVSIILALCLVTTTVAPLIAGRQATIQASPPAENSLAASVGKPIMITYLEHGGSRPQFADAILRYADSDWIAFDYQPSQEHIVPVSQNTSATHGEHSHTASHDSPNARSPGFTVWVRADLVRQIEVVH